MELFGLVAWQAMLLVLAIAGVVSFGVTHLLKVLYISYIQNTPENDSLPWWWNVSLRSLAILIGTAVGVLFSYAGMEFIVAVSIGFVGGILNTTLVKVVKDKLKSLKVGPADEVDPLAEPTDPPPSDKTNGIGT